MIKLKKLEISDRHSIQNFTHSLPPYSDFNLISLWSYNTEDDLKFYLDDDHFIIKMRDYITNEPIYSILSKNPTVKIYNELLKFNKQINMVPEISLIKNKKFDIAEDRDNFDYIVSTKDIANLKGKKYEHKRWRVNQFNRYFPNHKIKVSECKSESEHESILNLFDKWAKDRDDTEHERIAINRLLRSTDKLNVLSINVFEKNKLIGFTIVEKTGNYAVGHFMKGDTDYKGIYEMLYHEGSKFLYGIGCEYLNYEQDLGIENLRDSKMSWSPIKFLKKYTVSYN